MNAPSPTPAGLTIVALQNEDILRAVAGAALNSPAEVAKACGRETKHIGRQVALVQRDGLVTTDRPYALTDAGHRALQALDLAKGALDLQALQASGLPAAVGDVVALVHSQMRPNEDQPRDFFDDEELEQLAATIHAVDDVLENLTVYPPEEDGVHLIADGERRWRAVGRLIERGAWPAERPLLAKIKARALGSTALIALIANGQHAKLTMMEQARAYAELMAEQGLSARAAALKTGRDPRTVQEMVRVIREAHPDDIAVHEQYVATPEEERAAAFPVAPTWEWLRGTVREERPTEPPAEPRKSDVEEVALPDPASPEGKALLEQAWTALTAYNDAVCAGRTDDARAAAEDYSAVVISFNGGTNSGSAVSRGERPAARKIVGDALAAPLGEAPVWGQQGLFKLDINGMHVIVEVTDFHGPSDFIPGGGANLHIANLDQPFLSSTGYRSALGLHGPRTFCEAVTRHIVHLINQKGGAPQVLDQEYQQRLAEQEWPDLPLLQVPTSWLQYDDPLVVNGVRSPSLSRANQARLAAADGAPSNTGAGSREPALRQPTPQSPAREPDLDPVDWLALIELALKLEAEGEDTYRAIATGALWGTVEKYWLHAGFSRLATEHRLIAVSHAFPGGPHASFTEAGLAWLALRGVIDADALYAARSAAELPFQADLEPFSTPWLNVHRAAPDVTPSSPEPDGDEIDDDGAAAALETLYDVSEALESSDDFSRPDLFRKTGVAFPLRAGVGDELGVIFDAKGDELLTVDKDGELPADLVKARVMVIMATLNAVVAEGEFATSLADVKVAKDEGRAPAVPMRKSIYPDYIVCLETGRRVLSLAPHLRASSGLEPEAYRVRWGLPRDYPMVAPNYMQARANAARPLAALRPWSDEADD